MSYTQTYVEKGADRMKAVLVFEQSDALQERVNERCDPLTVNLDCPDGAWLQLTYDSIRSQDGSVIAFYDPGDNVWMYEGNAWSDVVISFEDATIDHGKD